MMDVTTCRFETINRHSNVLHTLLYLFVYLYLITMSQIQLIKLIEELKRARREARNNQYTNEYVNGMTEALKIAESYLDKEKGK